MLLTIKNNKLNVAFSLSILSNTCIRRLKKQSKWCATYIIVDFFDFLMVEFYYEQTGSYHKLLVVVVNCLNFKQIVYLKIDNRNKNYHIIVFIKDIIFHNFLFIG